jgi:hypothetical protein
MGVKFMLPLNAFMNIWCVAARLMGINRDVDELALFKLLLWQKGVWYMCGCPTRQWEHVKLILVFHQG